MISSQRNLILKKSVKDRINNIRNMQYNREFFRERKYGNHNLDEGLKSKKKLES